jgi:hypothetical protein
MSRIEQLKKQNPSYTIEIIDIINNLFEKVKYTELSVNLIKTKRQGYSRSSEDMINELVMEYGQDRENLTSKSYEELTNIFRVLGDYFGYHDFKTIQKFIELNERNLIKENDLSKFKSFEDLELQVSLSELKLIDKDLEKQVIKLYETDEWLVLKPMSFLASRKYGSNTKWCTTQENNPDYYLRYSRRGILIYCINKVTGEKVAAFKNIDTSYDRETSFWNMIDNRIDSIESGLSVEVMDVIKSEFTKTTKPNWDLLSDDDRNKQLIWIEHEYYLKKSYVGEEQPTPMEEGYMMAGVEEEPIRRARIVPMVAPRFDDIPTQAG